MEATRPARTTLVVTTTPTATFGLDELNAALRNGWRIIHMGVLGHARPGEDDEWPDGHFSALVLLEYGGGSPRSSESGRTAYLDDERTGKRNSDDTCIGDMSWPEYAI